MSTYKQDVKASLILFFFVQVNKRREALVWKMSFSRREYLAGIMTLLHPHSGIYLSQLVAACVCDTNVLPSGIYFDTYLPSSINMQLTNISTTNML